jgi:hypothetical protein
VTGTWDNEAAPSHEVKGSVLVIRANIPPLDQAGPLPNSLSPMGAVGRVAITGVCRLGNAARWSITLTSENSAARARANDLTPMIKKWSRRTKAITHARVALEPRLPRYAGANGARMTKMSPIDLKPELVSMMK